jgi:hypothetical protein
MRKVMMALAVGVVVVGFSGVSAQAGDEPGSALPTLSVKALNAVAKPGGVVTFDLYVGNVSDLGTYQFHIASSGGETGTLAFENIVIDVTRKDYVFTGLRSLPAVDKKGVRAGAVVMGGASRDVSKPEYIGTATFRASPDAKGTFEVNIVGDNRTFLRDSRGVPIVSRVGDPVKVMVSERVAPKRVDKGKR